MICNCVHQLHTSVFRLWEPVDVLAAVATPDALLLVDVLPVVLVQVQSVLNVQLEFGHCLVWGVLHARFPSFRAPDPLSGLGCFSLPALVAELLLQSTTGAQATKIGVSREWLEDIVCRVSVVEGTATAKCVDAFTQ